MFVLPLISMLHSSALELILPMVSCMACEVVELRCVWPRSMQPGHRHVDHIKEGGILAKPG